MIGTGGTFRNFRQVLIKLKRGKCCTLLYIFRLMKNSFFEMANVYPPLHIAPGLQVQTTPVNNSSCDNMKNACNQSIRCRVHYIAKTIFESPHGSEVLRGGGTRRPHRIRRVHNTLKSKKQCTIFYLFWITHPTRQLGVLSKRDIKTINALFFSFRTLHCGLLSKI